MIEILLSSFLGYFGAKCIKFLIGLYHQEKSLWKKFLITGGMPSAHASVTTALSTSIFLFEGLNSTFVEVGLTLNDLVNMKPGDVIPIDMPKSILIKAEEVPLCRAQFGVSNGYNAFKVTDWIDRPKVEKL